MLVMKTPYGLKTQAVVVGRDDIGGIVDRGCDIAVRMRIETWLYEAQICGQWME